MGGREHAGPSHQHGPATMAQGPELSAEDQARRDQADERTRAADEEALARFEETPDRAPLTHGQRFRLQMHEGQRLRIADARAAQLGDAEVDADQRETAKEQVETLVENLRAAKARCMPLLLEQVREARAAKRLRPEGSAAIMEAVRQALAERLASSANRSAQATVRTAVSSLGRGESFESLARDLDPLLTDRLFRALASKDAPAFDVVPTVDELVDAIGNTGERALSHQLGEHGKKAKGKGRGAETAIEGERGGQQGHSAESHDASAAVDGNKEMAKLNEKLMSTDVSHSSAAELAEAYPVKHAPELPDALLIPGEPAIDEQDRAGVELPATDGPHVISLPLRVAGTSMGKQSCLVWIEGGKIVASMPANQIPTGGFRRHGWLLYNDGHELQVVKQRAEDAAGVKQDAHDDKLAGRDLERREEAAGENNRDEEHFLAEGYSLDAAINANRHAKQEELVTIIQGTFRAFGVTAGVMAAQHGIDMAGNMAGREVHRATAARPEATEGQYAQAEVMQAGRLAPTEGNAAGLKKLGQVHDDPQLSPEQRAQYTEELKAKLSQTAAEKPEDNLHKTMRGVAYGKPGDYERTGAQTPADQLAAMGGLKRVIDLKSVCFNMTTDEWYEKAVQAAGDEGGLPKSRARLDWVAHAQKLADLVSSGKLELNTATDLRPDALVKGPEAGSSGWFFSGADAGDAVQSPEELQTQLAVGPSYAKGYIALTLPDEVAVKFGARKPTALDLTNSPEGTLNANASEAVGRTKPTAPGQIPVREVVLPPLPLSMMRVSPLIRGK